jgi:hypothetical protein
MQRYRFILDCSSCGINLNIYNDEDGFWAVSEYSVKTSVLSHLRSINNTLIAGVTARTAIHV